MVNLSLHIESLIFSSEDPVSLPDIKTCLQEIFETKFSTPELERAVEKLQEKYSSDEFAIEVVALRGGFTFLTKGAYHEIISQYLKQTTKKKLSKAALETLAIIAYKQPVTKGDVESIRGVNCDYTIQKLLEKDLVSIQGREDGPGRPLLYATSDKFMDYFGLKDIRDLPKLKDLKPAVNETGTTESIVEEAMKNKSDN